MWHLPRKESGQLMKTLGMEIWLYVVHLLVVEIDSKDPTRVKTDTCPGKFRKVLEICIRHSTSMISNDTQSQSEHSISQYY